MKHFLMNCLRVFAVLSFLSVQLLWTGRVEPVQAHNVDQRLAWMYFSPATLGTLTARAETSSFPLLRAGDEVSIIIKSLPVPSGATTGVGGYITFYIPAGTQVTSAAYVRPDGSGGYTDIPIKGQSIMPLGPGPVGAKTTSELIGLTLGGVSAVNGSGLHRGTMAGLYADTGIFYATDPRLAYGTWTGGAMVNNRGEMITPSNQWDAMQLRAYGRKDVLPIVDYGDGHGNTPWGLGSVVAGPQSGYAWQFDTDVWDASGKTAADMRNAADDLGPWNRIQYPGSMISSDTPGNTSTSLGYAGIDASSLGVALSSSNPLAETLSLSDSTSPKAIRWSVGQLATGVFEYARVNLKLLSSPHSPFDSNGCFYARSDVIGGDSGGEQGGKDHAWRYYDPSEADFNSCALLNKTSAPGAVNNGDPFTYTIQYMNSGNLPLTNLVLQDTLPVGVTFLSASPVQSSGPTPLAWTIPSLAPGAVFTATLNVRAASSDVEVVNLVTASNAEGIPSSAAEGTHLGSLAILELAKTASPSLAYPGNTVQYAITVDNTGSGPTGESLSLTDQLPGGLTYTSLASVTINNANGLASTSVDASTPDSPVFTINQALQAGKQLLLVFNATIDAASPNGSYCNQFSTTYTEPSSARLVTASSGGTACVTVSGAKIGDTVFRDWNGDGSQSSGDEGISGVTLSLWLDDGDNVFEPGSGDTSVSSKTTDSSGQYLFTGLAAGTYWVNAPAAGSGGIPTGYTLTTSNDPTRVILATNGDVRTLDFGFRPGGSGSIGDLVFADADDNRAFNTGDTGMNAITTNLYEDTNGDGSIGTGDQLVSSQDTNSAGAYLFTGLATGLSYIVDVDNADVTTYFGANPYSLSTSPEPRPVYNLAGANLAVDFGYYQIVGGSIGDQVFLDANRDGLYTSGETLLPNITVYLYQSDGTTLLQTTSTNVNGVYTFSNLPSNTYILKVDGSDPDLPSGLQSGLSQISTFLDVAESQTTIDFPFATVLDKSVNLANAEAGSNLTYTLTPRLSSLAPLTNAQVTDSLPSGTTFVSAGQGGVQSSGTVTWNLGSTATASNGTKAMTSPAGTSTISVDINPSQDTVIGLKSPTFNFGTCTTNKVFHDAKYVRMLLQFNLTNIPAGATITDASLILQQTAATTTAAENLNLYQVISSWTEGSVCSAIGNPNNTTRNDTSSWTTAGGDYNSTALVSLSVSNAVGSNTWNSVSLKNLVSNWYSSATPNYGLLIKTQTESGTNKQYHQYGMRENITTANRPILRVTYQIPTSTNYNVTTALSTSRTLAAMGDSIAVTLSATSSGTAGTVTPGSLTVNGTNGAAASCGAASPTSGTVNYGTRTFSYTCTVTAVGTSPGALTFSASPSDSQGTNNPWNTGTSNSVLVTPSLTYTVAVNSSSSPALVQNTAHITSTSGISSTASNTVTTVIGAGIGNFVWADLDGDGLQDNAEPGLKDVTVCARGAGTPACATTDAQGQYLIGGLSTGTYTTSLTIASLPAGYIPSTQTSLSVPLSSGQQYLSADFGVRPAGTASTGDLVWIDSDQDGSYTAGEQVLAGITVNLYHDLDSSGTLNSGDILVGTTTTSSSGVYSFSGLYGGAYLVQVDTSSSITSPFPGTTSTLAAAMSATPGTTNPHAITLTNGQTNLSADFGYNWSGSLGDFIWYDENGDGLQSGGTETGIAGVVVVLYSDLNGDGANNPGEPMLASTSTNSSGIYTFSHLYPGQYLVYQDDSTVQSKLGEFDIMVPTTAINIPVTLGAGIQYTAADGGWIEGATIGKRVFYDANHNGLFDSGESGLSGVHVYQYAADGASLLQTVLTDSTGKYLLVTAPGSYVIRYASAEIPSAYTQSTTSSLYTVIVDSGQVVQSANFGFDYQGEIGDTLFNDADANGSQSQGEPGLPDITVWLYNQAGDTLLATTVSDNLGKYLFPGLADGTYQVRVDSSTLPAGFTQTADPDQAGICTSCDNRANATLSSQGSVLDVDFGYQSSSTTYQITGKVWNDANANGTNNSEPNLIGVILYLYDHSDGSLVAGSTSDASGNFSFLGVVSGDYDLVVDTSSLPNPAYVQTGDPDQSNQLCTTCDSQTNITIANASASAKDFGYQEQLGSISGAVVLGDGNGVAGAGESGVSTTVSLRYAGQDGLLNTSDDVTTSTTTAADGSYAFSSLLPGSYELTKVNPSPLSALADADGYSPEYINVTLTAGQTQTQRDFELASLDFGDLPASYANTLLSDDGARHTTSGARLGISIDAESDGQESSAGSANQDDSNGLDDEDGIVVTGTPWLAQANGGTIRVIVSNCTATCYLAGWMDWNKDGLFETSERAFVDQAVTNYSGAAQPVQFDIPASAGTISGLYAMRFRLYESTTSASALPTGLAFGGEVEDAVFNLILNPTAVTAANFMASPTESGIQLSWWADLSGTSLLGFQIKSRSDPNETYQNVPDGWIPADLTSPGGSSYVFLDRSARLNRHTEYWLVPVDSAGKELDSLFSLTSGAWRVYLPSLLR